MSPGMGRKASIDQMETNKYKTFDTMHRTANNCTFVSKNNTWLDEQRASNMLRTNELRETNRIIGHP